MQIQALRRNKDSHGYMVHGWGSKFRPLKMYFVANQIFKCNYNCMWHEVVLRFKVSILIQWRSYGLYGSNPGGIKIKHILQYQVCDTDSYEPLGLIPIHNRSTIIAQLCSSWECFCHLAPCHCTIVYFSDPDLWSISQ